MRKPGIDTPVKNLLAALKVIMRARHTRLNYVRGKALTLLNQGLADLDRDTQVGRRNVRYLFAGARVLPAE